MYIGTLKADSFAVMLNTGDSLGETYLWGPFKYRIDANTFAERLSFEYQGKRIVRIVIVALNDPEIDAKAMLDTAARIL